MRRMDRKRKAAAKTPVPGHSSARFVEPMLLLRADSLPDSGQWLYEPDSHLRHSRFVDLREDKEPRSVVRE